MDRGFEEANSSNLPDVDHEMVDLFYRENADFLIAGVQHVKAKRVSQRSYVDEAIGFVQIQRKYPICTVKARVTPEHKVRNKPYNVTVLINEEQNEILECKCHDCAASEGGCKHAVALLYWLLKRSDCPSVTSVLCYWKKSTLSKVGTLKATRVSTIMKRKVEPLQPKSGNFLNEIIPCGIANSSRGISFAHYQTVPTLSQQISLYHMMLAYKEGGPVTPSAENFIDFLKTKMNKKLCEQICTATVDQSECPEWFATRFGRITASKLYEVALCKTIEGTLTQAVLGASKFVQTPAMKRGLLLEKQVLKVISERKNIICRRSGIVILDQYPIFGASPDAITDDLCIEIKCPSKASTVKNYIVNGAIAKKPLAQIQLQMMLCGKGKGLFCVASPKFERNKEVDIVEVKLDRELCTTLMMQAETFWKKAIFPILFK